MSSANGRWSPRTRLNKNLRRRSWCRTYGERFTSESRLHLRLMSEETEIYFPESDSLPFPFTVRSLLTQAGNTVERGSKLLNYSFVYRSNEPGSSPETRFGSWDATFEGDLKSWTVKPGEVITRERAKSRPALRIVEPCKHGVQFNGLCALCGIDMTRCAMVLYSMTKYL